MAMSRMEMSRNTISNALQSKTIIAPSTIIAAMTGNVGFGIRSIPAAMNISITEKITERVTASTGLMESTQLGKNPTHVPGLKKESIAG